MDPTLDTLIGSSSPPVAARTRQLEEELSALVVAAEVATARRPRRLRARAAVSGIAAVGLVTLGAGASAAGMVPAPTWAPWYDDPAAEHTQMTSSGKVCEVRYDAKEIHDLGHPVEGTRLKAALKAARAFLADFDFSTIKVERAVEHLPATAVESGAEPEDVETFAVQFALQEQLDDELASQGLPTAAVSVSAALWCDGGEQ